ncbi:transcription factor BIM1 isoform X1 [Senna tora]|uniref:Transcription factor BIM1 isoform X1 n=1 Tax=Senna tora TaxID=362788 RepID=A0A834X5F7_9FABA|nr:transcription factor BIM1 isoform X1 [Senna tora]
MVVGSTHKVWTVYPRGKVSQKGYKIGRDHCWRCLPPLLIVGIVVERRSRAHDEEERDSLDDDDGASGRRKTTHDFLSLYSTHSSAQQDPPRPSSQGSYLKTQDFLQPLERKEKKLSSNANAKEEAGEERSWGIQKASPPTMEHVLPGGIGTYSISHISNYFNNQMNIPKAEAPVFAVAQASSTDIINDDNSNCSSYTGGSGFSLWEESAVNKGKTRKENTVVEKPISGDSAAKLGQWALAERTSQSYSNTRHNNFNSLPSSQLVVLTLLLCVFMGVHVLQGELFTGLCWDLRELNRTSGQKKQSVIEMIKSAKGDCIQDEEPDNEEAFILKKECCNAQIGEMRVKVDGKSTDQKPNTPRSKHSATEQRRRSKINDRQCARFQMLRDLIPHSDQKRDKASFLLEVIEYIHFLQEKVHKYEGSYQEWNHEAEKLMPWRKNYRPAESYIDQSCGSNGGAGLPPTSIFDSKLDEKNITIIPAFPGCTQNVESGINPATTNKAMPNPVASQPNLIAPAQNGSPDGVVSQLSDRLPLVAENNIYQPSAQCQTYSFPTEVTPTNDKPKEKEVTIEGGAISISSVYSRGMPSFVILEACWLTGFSLNASMLLNTLTQALQSSGVDLSRASISVQIELGKQANIRHSVPTSGAQNCGLLANSSTILLKDNELVSGNQGMARPRVANAEDSNHAAKKPKTRRS